MSVRRDLPVSTLVWQAHTTAWVMTAICKATFVLRQGELSLAETQEGVYEHDNHWNDDRERSLSTASDLAPVKLRSDVVLVGHTFAPEETVVRSLVARLVVGSIDKSVEAHVDRAVGQDGAMVEGAPFSRMRLVYERAAGGPGTWNPAGVRVGTRDAFGRGVLPNITLPGRRPRRSSLRASDRSRRRGRCAPIALAITRRSSSRHAGSSGRYPPIWTRRTSTLPRSTSSSRPFRKTRRSSSSTCIIGSRG